ncbi:MAG: hypothetical protein KC635_13725 [Myxococcales bacterium]|nr:hypothetical protein [Myxococcales bacterium]MCB9735659.1 hypothetical protein [Deltaproteobacteria bacterium]
MRTQPRAHALRLPALLALAALITLGALAPAPAARAKDVNARLGLGGAIESDFRDSGLSFKYWLSNVGFETIFSLGIHDGTDGDLDYDIGFGLRGLYNLSRTDSTNLFVGGGVLLHQVINGPGDRQVIEVLLGMEHFFTDYFAISGHLGFRFGLSDTSIDFARGAAWGGGFHFYF